MKYFNMRLTTYFLFVLSLSLSQCTLYKRDDAPDNELKDISEEVIKEKRGVSIQIIPILGEKNVLR